MPIKPESLALEHIHSGKSTFSSILNKILLNQNLLVTNSKLTQLLNVKGVELGSVWVKKGIFFTQTYTFTSLDLTISSPENNKLLAELTGQSKHNGFFGVYMFIHKNTGHKYVGSSNLLRRRMDY